MFWMNKTVKENPSLCDGLVEQDHRHRARRVRREQGPEVDEERHAAGHLDAL